jgi:hypothetical protein
MKTRKTSIALLVAATCVAAACSNSPKTPEPPAANMAPQLAAIANVTTDQDTTVGPLEFAVSDDVTPPNQLTVTATLDGTTPFPTDGVTLAGTGATRSITLKPLESTTGTANVTVTVIDASGLKATRSFGITVNARAASVKDAVAATFTKTETDDATPLNGFTFTQDADDPDTFAGLVAAP